MALIIYRLFMVKLEAIVCSAVDSLHLHANINYHKLVWLTSFI